MTDVYVGSDDSARSDAELILDVRGGDLEAYGALYVRHVPAARAVARQYVHSAADADDIVSESFHRVLDVLQHGGGPDATFRAYLLTVVRHLAADLARGVRRTRPTADDGTFEAALGFVDSTDVATFEGFEHSVVKNAYQALPERWQAVLWYTEIEGRAPAEVAPILGLTPNGVSALAYRAREGLRVGYLQEHLTYAPTDGCRAVNPLLGGYVRGGLARREVAKVDAHLGDCGECRSLVLELGDIAHGMRAVVAPLIVGLAGMAVVGALPIGGSIVGALGGAAVGGAAVGGGAVGGGAVGGGAVGSAVSVGTVTGSTAGSTVGGATASIGTTATTTTAATTAATTTAASAGTTAATGAASLAGTTTAGVATGSAATAASAGTAAAAGAFMGTTAGVAAAAGAVAVATVGVVTVLNALSTTPDSPAAPPAAITIPGEPWAAPWEPPLDAEVEPGEDAVDTPADPTTDPTTPVNLLSVTPFPPLPDLAVASANGPLDPRTVQSLVLTVTNTGGATADGAVVEVALPDGVDLALPDAPLGTAAGTSFAADALACTPADDGGRRARCALGTIEPGASRTGSVPVRAGSGGSYAIGASVWADNLAAETVDLPPTTVLPYGAELTASTGDAVVLSNPGAAWVPLAVRNTGDQPASAGWSVLVTVPDGLRPVSSDGDLTCSPATGGSGASTSSGGSGSTGEATTATAAVLTTTGGTSTGGTSTAGTSRGTSWSCASGADAAPLGPGEQRSVRVRVIADGTFAPGTATVTAAPQLPGSSHALPGRTAVDVAQPWAGAGGGVRSIQARCAAVGGVTTASAVVEATYVNLTDQTLEVRLDAAGSSGTAGRQVAPGESVTVRVPDGLRVPAGGASWTLSTTLGGETYRTSVAAGPHSSAECYAPRWDVSTAAETVNVDGRLQVRGTLTNTSDEAMRVGMTAAAGSADEKRVAPGESATFVVPTDRTTLGADAAEFQLYRWVADADGDQPQQGAVPAVAPTARYASAVLAPAVGGPAQLVAGECAYDADTETSRRTVTIPLDNTGSTHAVRFAVTGGLGEGRSAVVEAGRSGALEVPVAWGTRAVTLTADGRELATVDVPAFDGCATVSWPDATVDVTTATRCVDDRAQVVVEVRNRGKVAWAAGVTGGGESVVQPGSSATLVARTGGLEADGGSVTVRLARTIEDRRPAVERTVSYDAVSCVVVAPQARLDLGDVQVDKHRWRSTSTRSATVELDNSGSSVPVDFRVTGTNGVTRETTVGARQSASVDGGTVTGRTGASFTVSAGNWSAALSVEPFTGTTGWCATPLRWRGDHEVGEVASWRGSNYRYVGAQGWDGGDGQGVAQGPGVASQGHGRWFGHDGRYRGWERIGACE